MILLMDLHKRVILERSKNKEKQNKLLILDPNYLGGCSIE